MTVEMESGAVQIRLPVSSNMDSSWAIFKVFFIESDEKECGSIERGRSVCVKNYLCLPLPFPPYDNSAADDLEHSLSTNKTFL